MSEAVRKSGMEFVIDYFRDFKVLAENPKEYWGIQIVNFLDSTAYFAFLTIITIFLSNDIGFDDKNAGYVVTGVTAFVTFCLFLSGLMADWLGIKKALYVSLVGKLGLSVAVGALAFVEDFPGRNAIVVVLLLSMAPFLAMIQTVFQAANARYTTKRSRSAGFNLWYLAMNIGAAAAGALVDFVRLVLKLPVTWVILAGAVTSVLSMLAMLALVRSEKQAYGKDESPEDQAAATPVKKNPLQILKEMLRETAFWRFVVLISLLLGVRAVFVYMYLLMPKYWMRVMGEGAAIGVLNMINPILIIGGLILFIPITNRFNVFKMLTYGALISAVSLFALVIPWTVLSDRMVYAYYIMNIICMLVLSLGEVIWSPKLSEYTAAIAPPGQEGSYLGMSMMPWFFAKMMVSLISGHMLVRWVPEGIGHRIHVGTANFVDTPEMMWVYLGAWALIGPVIAIMFRGWLTEGARWKSDASVPDPQGPAVAVPTKPESRGKQLVRVAAAMSFAFIPLGLVFAEIGGKPKNAVDPEMCAKTRGSLIDSCCAAAGGTRSGARTQCDFDTKDMPRLKVYLACVRPAGAAEAYERYESARMCCMEGKGAWAEEGRCNLPDGAGKDYRYCAAATGFEDGYQDNFESRAKHCCSKAIGEWGGGECLVPSRATKGAFAECAKGTGFEKALRETTVEEKAQNCCIALKGKVSKTGQCVLPRGATELIGKFRTCATGTGLEKDVREQREGEKAKSCCAGAKARWTDELTCVGAIDAAAVYAACASGTAFADKFVDENSLPDCK